LKLACLLTGAAVGAYRAGSRVDFPSCWLLRCTIPQFSVAQSKVLVPFIADCFSDISVAVVLLFVKCDFFQIYLIVC